MNNYFSQKIIEWYHLNKRDLPWRNTSNPYYIWLSEIILQQTRVEQGMEYYKKFVKTFPTVKHLARAENDVVMKLWQGLGYYSRARNLHTTAKTIHHKYNNKFPDNYAEILSLKGIGEYTASAISSFAYNQPYAVVDGNVFRVLSRVFGVKSAIDNVKGKKEFTELANELLDKKNPALHNQAIMEFGALQCKPVNPNCEGCLLHSRCFAFANKMVDVLPYKEKKTRVRNRFFDYVILYHKGKMLLNKRTEKDIWQNLFDFPLFENDKPQTEKLFLKSEEWKKFTDNLNYSVKLITATHKHILSHQHIYARFWYIKLDKPFNVRLAKGYMIVNVKDFKNYAVPRLIEKYFKPETLL